MNETLITDLVAQQALDQLEELDRLLRVQDLVALAVRLGGHQLLRKVIHAVGHVFLYAAHVLGQDLRHAKAHINRRAQIQRAAAQVERILRQGGVVGADMRFWST